MGKIRLTKEFNFEMAHALYGHDGPCKNIHGHSYKLSVTVTGKVNNNSADPKNGMVMDFSVLKDIIKEKITNEFDHALVLNAASPHKEFIQQKILFEKIILAEYQPTCENLLIEFKKRISNELPKNILLHHLRLRETPSSYAEWYASDNNII